MVYVLLVAHPWWEPHDRSRAEQVSEWARRVDASDGSMVTTLSHDGDGGPLRHVEMPLRRSGEQGFTEGSEGHFSDMLDRVVRSYGRAASLSEHGTVGVSLGHGYADARSAWIDLAPDRAVCADGFMVAQAYREQRAGSPSESPKRSFLRSVGERLREGGVRRVDLYSCAVGASEQGQELLDWLHALWSIPVRGLRGVMVVRGRHVGGMVDPGAAITVEIQPMPGTPPLAGFGQQYSNLLTDRRLWRTSRPGRAPPVGEE